MKSLFWQNNAEFAAEVKNRYKHKISEVYTKVFKPSEGNADILSFDIEIPSQGLYLDIYSTSPQKALVGSYTIPSEIIREDIKYINDGLVLGSAPVFKSTLNEMINRFDKAIQCRSYGFAKQILSSEMMSHIEKNLKNKNSAIVGVEVDKNVLNGHVMEALSRLSAAIPEANQPVNPFVSLCLSDNTSVGQDSKLEIDFVKKPLGRGKKYVAKAWFDNEEVEVIEANEKTTAVSKTLTLGGHNWQVKTYMVDVKSYDSTKRTLAQTIVEINTLQSQYNKETDPAKKQNLQNQINTKQGRKSQLEVQLQNELKELSVPSNMYFEVKP